jgi:hypothetical protein
MRERTISEEGLKLFNLSMDDLSHRKTQLKKNKGLLRSVMIDLFTTEYDINLIDTVDKLRMSSCYLYSNLDYKNPKKISVLVNNAITNIIIAILTFNGEISNRHQLKMNYYNYLDIAEKSYKNEDHHTAIVIRAALNTLSITRLNIKLRKKDKRLYKLFDKKYGTFKDCCKKHLYDVMNIKDFHDKMKDNDNISIIPSLMILIIHLNKATEYSKSFKSIGKKSPVTLDAKRIQLIRVANALKKKYSKFSNEELIHLYTDRPEEHTVLNKFSKKQSDSVSIKLFDLSKCIPSPKRKSCFF